MAYQRYSTYQYETTPRKIETQYQPRKNQYENKKVSNKRVEKNIQKKHMKSRAKVIAFILLGFAILFGISYRNSQITEIFNEKEKLKKELSLIEKENEQLKINIENNLNLNTIEQLAKEKLGMQKLNNNQKVYVSIEKKDYIEPASEEVIIKESNSIWDKLFSKLNNVKK